MQPTGYSHRPLAAKLGLAPGMRALLLDAPPGYLATLGEVAAQVELCAPPASDLDFIQVFATDHTALVALLPQLVAALTQRGALWVCWPKRAAKPAEQLSGDLRESLVREAGLAAGLVDVKVAAIDPVWSGLKFVFRLRDRTT
ncbi:MAG TPA: hypothetical protein VID72_12785 [Ktedonobacterales bacterium]